jgi:hypothetical protein
MLEDMIPARRAAPADLKRWAECQFHGPQTDVTKHFYIQARYSSFTGTRYSWTSIQLESGL